MIIIYNKKTGKVLYECGRPVNYEDDREMDAIENEEVVEEIEVEETDEFGNVTIKKETVKKTIPKLVKGHTIYFNPDIFDTAEVPNTFRERYYNEDNA